MGVFLVNFCQLLGVMFDEKAFYGGADIVWVASSGDGNVGIGSDPEDGDLGADVLPVEEEVWWSGCFGVTSAEAIGGGESSVEEIGCGPQSGQAHASGCSLKKVIRPGRQRELVSTLMDRYRVGERKACSALRFHRSTIRYRSKADDQAGLRMRIHEIAATRVRYGYRRIHVLLVREGWRVNPKRVYRLYREEGLALRNKRPKRHVSASHRVGLYESTDLNESWSMDFVSDNLYNGRRFRVLTIVDNLSRESLGILVD